MPNPLDYLIKDQDAMRYALLNDSSYRVGGQVQHFDEGGQASQDQMRYELANSPVMQATPRSPMQDAIGTFGGYMDRAGKFVSEAIAPTAEKHPVKHFLANMLLADSLKSAGTLMQDLTGTVRETDEENPVRGVISKDWKNLTTSREPLLDPRALDLAGFATPVVKGVTKLAGVGAKALTPFAKNTAEMAAELYGRGQMPGMVAPNAYMAEPSAPKPAKALAPANEQTKVVVPKETKATSKIPEGEELIAHHNLSPAKLFGADALGGMPVPSLAISKASEPMTNFGEITLIAPSSLAEPSAKNPVFRSDAYTATKPNTTFSIDNKSESNLKNLLSNTMKNIPDGDHEFYRVVDDIKELAYNPLIRSKFLEEKGVLPNKDDFAHKYDFRRAVDEIINGNKNEYESWLDNFQASLPDNGVDIKERIFKGYTNMGNRRYVDANLENFVKEMKGIDNRQSFFGSPAYLRAVATPKFKNFKEVKSERSRIVSAEDFETSKKETDEKFEDLNKKLREISGYDSRDALAEVAETKNPNVLDRIYGEGNVSSELKKEIVSFVNELKSLPTGYFEAKPQRAVGLSEFAGAIIPKDSTDKVRAILKKNGITDIHEYSTPEERLSLFKKYGKHMFSAVPVAVGAGLNEVAESQEDQNNMKRGGKVSFAPNVDAMRHELTKAK